MLGHELMHVYNHDILTSSIASAMSMVITYLGYSLMYFGGGSDRDGGRRGNPIGALLTMVLAPIGASLIQMAISRTREYDADEDGSRLTEDPQALANALRKIEAGVGEHPLRPTNATRTMSAVMIANPFNTRTVSRLFSTHPPTEDRIVRLEEMQREMYGESSVQDPADEQYMQH